MTSKSRSRKSAKSSGQPKLPPLFINRSLGRHEIPTALTNLGFEVVTLAEMYGEKPGQFVSDEQWIRETTGRGLVCISKDRKSLLGIHLPTIRKVRAKIFIMAGQQLRAEEQIDRLTRHRFKIAQKAAKRGPMVYVVGKDSLSKKL